MPRVCNKFYAIRFTHSEFQSQKELKQFCPLSGQDLNSGTDYKMTYSPLGIYGEKEKIIIIIKIKYGNSELLIRP